MNKALEERVIAHGKKLLKVFPGAAEQDPVKLCKKLLRIEHEAHAFATGRCNGMPQDMTEEAENAKIDAILKRVGAVLGKKGPRVMFNLDCRGYALKIDSDDMEKEWVMDGFHRDWGGNGIIAPDLS